VNVIEQTSLSPLDMCELSREKAACMSPPLSTKHPFIVEHAANLFFVKKQESISTLTDIFSIKFR
jgi:hypothetical protein